MGIRRRGDLGRPALVWAVVAVIVLVVFAGCKSAPEPEPPPAAEAPVDPGWVMRTVDTSMSPELPEPFVKLVDLARLRIGMTKAEVLAIFPDPYEIALRGNDDVWQYGFAELIFRNDRLMDWFDIKRPGR
jgi:hypothetical protein